MMALLCRPGMCGVFHRDSRHQVRACEPWLPEAWRGMWLLHQYCLRWLSTRRGGPAPAPAPPIEMGFDFSEVGFGSDTLVRVRDLFNGRDLGVFSGSFSTAEVHGGREWRGRAASWGVDVCCGSRANHNTVAVLVSSDDARRPIAGQLEWVNE